MMALRASAARRSVRRPSRGSARDWRDAQRYLVGGVNSPVRSFRSVGGAPLFIERAAGSKLYATDGRAYVDLIMGWGPHILGHAHPAVMRAAAARLKHGTAYGLPTAIETELARAISEALPSIEQVRFTSSGTEACMSAIRLARGATGRTKMLKFAGCYHGHADAFLVQAGSGLATYGVSDSAGVPAAVARETLVAEYNDLDGVERLMRKAGHSVASIIVEPVAANMGLVPPRPGFLEGLRTLCSRYGALLIFDEVISGFRVAYGGAQGRFGVRPDLTVLGKIIGGGFPCGAFGGRRSLMRRLAPLGPVYQAGTLSGHPVAMASGLALLAELRRPGVYARLETAGVALAAALRREARRAAIPAQINQFGSLFTLFFTDAPVTGWRTAKTVNRGRFNRFFHAVLQEGVLWPPSPFEACFLSTAHTAGDGARIIRACRAAFKQIKSRA